MLAKLKYSVDQDVQDLMPEAIEIAKNKKRERLKEVQRSLMKPQRTTSPYVTTFNESNGGYGSTYYHSANAHLNSPITFRNTPRQKSKPKKRTLRNIIPDAAMPETCCLLLAACSRFLAAR